MHIYIKQMSKITGELPNSNDTNEHKYLIKSENGIEISITIRFYEKKIEAVCQKEISDEFYRFLTNGVYNGFEIYEKKWIFRNNIDKKIIDKFIENCHHLLLN